MAKKILFGIIGALVAFFLFILGVMLETRSIGFQNAAVLELSLNIIIGLVCWKKFPENEAVKNLSLGAMGGSIIYLALILIAETVVFSLVSGITH